VSAGYTQTVTDLKKIKKKENKTNIRLLKFAVTNTKLHSCISPAHRRQEGGDEKKEGSIRKTRKRRRGRKKKKKRGERRRSKEY